MVNITTLQDLVDYLNSLQIKQKNLELMEDLPEDVYNLYFKDAGWVDSNNIDKHRWFEYQDEYYNLSDNVQITDLDVNDVIGVFLISNIYSESSDVEDFEHIYNFFIGIPKQVITYNRKM
jgi:hypothetical protein